MSTTTTTTTEISSNSNSSCRLLVCLNSLPFHDQRVFRSLLGHIELLRLSACCRSLRSSIRNDKILWQQLYHRDFLSGAYYAKEMEFVLWCIRTDVNNPCTSDKRADLLENVDWYNTYRRRVSTENNWRYGRCKTTRIDLERDEHGPMYYVRDKNNYMFITQRNRIGRASGLRRHYTLEYLPHSDLRSNNSIEYKSTFSTSPNVLSLNRRSEARYAYVTGDHYIAVSLDRFEHDTNLNVKIHSRRHGDVFITLDVPPPYKVEIIEGKWALLVDKGQPPYMSSPIYHIMVFDIDNSVMCPGSIDVTWRVACFYKTTDSTATLYTARLVKDDDVDCIEWALYQFSTSNPVVQLRNGWLQLPEKTLKGWIETHNPYDSRMGIQVHGHPATYNSYIIHSVASSGQNHTPLNSYIISDQHIPIPLLRAGCIESLSCFRPREVLTDLTYDDDQILRVRGADFIRHIIGDLYAFITVDEHLIGKQVLIDISTKEIIRKLKKSNPDKLRTDAMLGMMYCPYEMNMLTIQEYGEL